MTRAIQASAVAALCAGLVACGGESDEDQVKEVATQLANTDEKVCDQATNRFLKALGGKKRCQQAAKADDGSVKAKVGKVTVDDDSATAELTARGDKAKVSLVKDGDDWKLDSVR